MLQRIEARTFRIHLLKETEKAKKGEATVFHVRQMSHREATLYDIDLSTLEETIKSLDRENKGRAIEEFRNGKFAEVVEKIERYGDGTGEPIADPVLVKRFPIEYLTPEETEFILRQSKNGFLLREMDEEISKNG